MPTFTIDGKEITIDDDISVLNAALRNGIYIPHFCSHPAFSTVGNCRMCMVEIEMGERKMLTTACTNKPADGMIVETHTDQVIATRQSVMEFLLINHPLDCPVCDQAGQCVLQDYSYKYGIPESRFSLDKGTTWEHNIPRKQVGEHILLYNDRCIRCTRCVRFLREVTGTEELGVFQRGVESEIDIFAGRTVDNPLAGNIVDTCPVGSLINKDFLFKCRFWSLQSTKSICPVCAKGCNIIIDASPEREEILRLCPRVNQEVNGFWMCDYGRFGFDDFFGSERLRTPLIKSGGTREESSAEKAIEQISDSFRQILDKFGKEAFAIVFSPYTSNEDAMALGKLASAIGGPHLYLLPAEIEQEEKFPLFTIEAERAPNVRGIKAIAQKLNLPLGELETLEADLQAGRIKALYLFCNAPSNYKELPGAESCQNLELSIIHDLFSDRMQKSEGKAYTFEADFLLPALSFAEMDGSYNNVDGITQQFWQGIERVEKSLAAYEVVLNIAERQELNVGFASFADLQELTFDVLNASLVRDRLGGMVSGRFYHNYY